MPAVTIDGEKFEVPEGINLLEACTSSGVKLEHFCYHSHLPVDGNCRTCMVEIEGPRGPMLTIACNTKVTEGMVVHTTSEKAVGAQKSALEFLLLDHPLDCPICDKAGECKLQDHYMDHGLYDHRRIVPRSFKGGKAVDAGEHIMLDQERCILCTRCVRFLDNVPGSSELGIFHRGHESTIDIFPGKPIANDYSGNVTDVCPVGALTLKEFRFKQRVWFLKKAPSVCNGCARGCSITVEHNRGRAWRFMPRENEKLNRVWLCDDGRFSFKDLDADRFFRPIVDGAETDEARGLAALAEALRGAGAAGIEFLAGPYSSNETLFTLKKLAAALPGSNLTALVPPADGVADNLLRLAARYPNQNGLVLAGISQNMDGLIKRLEAGSVKVLVVVEPGPRSPEDARTLAALGKAATLAVFSSQKNGIASSARIAIPVRNFAETNGTFVNATSLLQAARLAYEPHESIPAPALALAGLGRLLGKPGFDFAGPEDVFAQVAVAVPALAGLRFTSIPAAGVELDLPPLGPPPFENKKIDFNVRPNPGSVRV